MQMNKKLSYGEGDITDFCYICNGCDPIRLQDSPEGPMAEAIDIVLTNGLSFIVNLKEEVN